MLRHRVAMDNDLLVKWSLTLWYAVVVFCVANIFVITLEVLSRDSITFSLEAFTKTQIMCFSFSSSTLSDLRLFSVENKQKSYSSEVRCQKSEPKLKDYAKMLGEIFSNSTENSEILFFMNPPGGDVRFRGDSKILGAFFTVEF